MRADLFEVTSDETAVATRRLTSAAAIQAMGVGGDGDDTAALEAIIDRVSARLAAECRLARDVGGKIPTFATQTCRATWHATTDGRASAIMLPWRVPVTAIGSVVEAGVTLAATAYRHVGAGQIIRLSGDYERAWSSSKIVVTYTAGFPVSAATPPLMTAPADIEARVIDQVRMEFLARSRDPSVRSENVPDVYQASYAVAGGDSFGVSGLLASLEGALAPYRLHLVP